MILLRNNSQRLKEIYYSTATLSDRGARARLSQWHNVWSLSLGESRSGSRNILPSGFEQPLFVCWISQLITIITVACLAVWNCLISWTPCLPFTLTSAITEGGKEIKDCHFLPQKVILLLILIRKCIIRCPLKALYVFRTNFHSQFMVYHQHKVRKWEKRKKRLRYPQKTDIYCSVLSVRNIN